MNDSEIVFSTLKELQIDFELLEHKPVFTVEQGLEAWVNLDAMHCKNLFLRNKKGNQHYLVVIKHDKQFSIKNFWKRFGNERFSFASEKRMEKYLKILPGSVSPFGLIHDTENHVKVFIDSELKSAERISFHPNNNAMTLAISFHDFEKYMKWTANYFEFIEIKVG